MHKNFTCWRSTKIPLLSLSLAVFACLPLGRGTIASPLSPSPKQQSNPTKIVSVDRPPALPTDSKSPTNLAPVAANSSPAETIKAQGTGGGRSLEIREIRGTVTFKGRPGVVGDRLLAAAVPRAGAARASSPRTDASRSAAASSSRSASVTSINPITPPV